MKDIGPSRLIVSLTNRCNLQCIMCSTHRLQREVVRPPHIDLPLTLADRLADGAGDLMVITVAGKGEPTLAPDFTGWIRALRHMAPRAAITLTTNAQTRRWPERVAPILGHLAEFHVSLNGVATYERVSGGARFDRLESNLEWLYEAHSALRNPPRLALGYVVMRDNVDELDRAAAFAHEVGASRLHFKTMWVHGDDMRSRSIAHDRDLYRSAMREINRVSERWSKRGLLVRSEFPEANTGRQRLAQAARTFLHRPLYPPYDVHHFRRMLLTARRARGHACADPWDRPYIGEGGYVHLCCASDILIGHLADATLGEHWRGADAQRHRTGLDDGTPPSDCARCPRIAGNSDGRNYEWYDEASDTVRTRKATP